MRRLVAWPQALLVSCVLSTLGTGICAGEVLVGGARCRTALPYDAGSVGVLLRNHSVEQVRVHEVRINGRTLGTLPDETALWWRMSPDPLARGAVGVLTVKLSDWETSSALSVAAVTDDGQTVGPVTLARRPVPGVGIEAVRFGPAFETYYAYLCNHGDAPVEVESVQINGSEVGTKAGFGESGALGPDGATTCLVGQLPPGVGPGADVVVWVRMSSGATAFAHLRAFRSVPIHEWHSSDLRPEMRFDPWEFLLPPPRLGVPVPATGPGHEHSAFQLTEDVATADYTSGVLGAHAPEMVRRAAVCRQVARTRRTFLLVTEYCQELAYLCYAPIPDLMAIAPYRLYRNPGSPLDGNKCYFDVAREAAAPVPFAVVLEARRSAYMPERRGQPAKERWITPLEHELNVAHAIGCGANGFLVWTREGDRGYDNNEELKAAIAQANGRLHALEPLVSVAAVCDVAKTDEPGVACYSLMVADRGVLLVLVNDDIERGKSIWETPVARPHSSFGVHVRAPRWLDLGAATDLNDPTQRVTVTVGDGETLVEIDGLRTHRVILLHSQSATAQSIIDGLMDESVAPPP